MNNAEKQVKCGGKNLIKKNLTTIASIILLFKADIIKVGYAK